MYYLVATCRTAPHVPLYCRRALELVYSLVNENNIRNLTKELLDYLSISDAEFKPDLTAKICTLIQR